MEKLVGSQTVAKLTVKINEIIDAINILQSASSMANLFDRIEVLEKNAIRTEQTQ